MGHIRKLNGPLIATHWVKLSKIYVRGDSLNQTFLEWKRSSSLLGGLCSLTCSPLRQVGAVAGELEDPGVAVAVGHEDVPGAGVHGHVGGLAEVAAVTSWSKGLAQRQQRRVSAVAAHLEHLSTEQAAGESSGRLQGYSRSMSRRLVWTSSGCISDCIVSIVRPNLCSCYTLFFFSLNIPKATLSGSWIVHIRLP